MDKLTGGLVGLAKQRKVEVIHGEGKLTGAELAAPSATATVTFDNCIIAAGSEAGDDPRPARRRRGSSTRPARCRRRRSPSGCSSSAAGSSAWRWRRVYDALGAKVTVVEMLDQLIPGCDPDLVRALSKRIGGRYEDVLLATKVESIRPRRTG